MSFNGYVYVVCGLLFAGCVTLYQFWDAADDARDRAEAALETRTANETIVTKYVEKIVKIPGPAVIRERLVAGVCHTITLPGAGHPDAAAGADANAGQADEAGALAADLAAVQRNRAKLEALQAVLTPQLK